MVDVFLKGLIQLLLQHLEQHGVSLESAEMFLIEVLGFIMEVEMPEDGQKGVLSFLRTILFLAGKFNIISMNRKRLLKILIRF